MNSQTNRPIEVLALLLCSPTAAAQGNRAVHCAPDAFSPCSSHIAARAIAISSEAAEGLSSKVPAGRPAEANG